MDIKCDCGNDSCRTCSDNPMLVPQIYYPWRQHLIQQERFDLNPYYPYSEQKEEPASVYTSITTLAVISDDTEEKEEKPFSDSKKETKKDPKKKFFSKKKKSQQIKK